MEGLQVGETGEGPNSIQLPRFQYIRNISESIVLILALTRSTVSICNKYINHHTPKYLSHDITCNHSQTIHALYIYLHVA